VAAIERVAIGFLDIDQARQLAANLDLAALRRELAEASAAVERGDMRDAMYYSGVVYARLAMHLRSPEDW
jgi:hypothetical protein